MGNIASLTLHFSITGRCVSDTPVGIAPRLQHFGENGHRRLFVERRSPRHPDLGVWASEEFGSGLGGVSGNVGECGWLWVVHEIEQ